VADQDKRSPGAAAACLGGGGASVETIVALVERGALSLAFLDAP
jgi:hypothetical protein